MNNPAAVQIQLSADEVERFRRGNEKAGVFETLDPLIRIATQIGLRRLERVNFDIAGVVSACPDRQP